MPVLSKEDLLAKIRERVGDDTSDETLRFIEDVSDTIDGYETRLSGDEDWKKKYEENDKEWREKYKERFFNTPSKEESEDEENDKPKHNLTYEELFKED